MDPAAWRLNEQYCNLHRKVFWEAFAEDKWQSLALGRPPQFPKWMVRCNFPFDGGEIEAGELNKLHVVIILAYFDHEDLQFRHGVIVSHGIF